MVQIDVCVDKSKSTTEKGSVLEHLVAKLLEVAMNIVKQKPDISEREMGEMLEKQYNKQWKEGSRIRYGSAVRRWARYFLGQNDDTI